MKILTFADFWPVWYKDKSQTEKKKIKKIPCFGVSFHTGMCYFGCEPPLPIYPLHPLLAPGGMSDFVRLALAPGCWHNTCQTPSYSPLTSSQIFLSDFLLLRVCLDLVWVFISGNNWQEQHKWPGKVSVTVFRCRFAELGCMEIWNHHSPL